jgi:hypothetical protein
MQGMSTTCSQHPDFPIGGECTQCKAPLCVRCAPELAYASRPLCGSCKGAVKTEAGRDEVKSLALEIGAVQLIVAGLWAAFATTLDGVSDDARLLLIAAVSGPAIAGALLTAATRRALVPALSLGLVAVELGGLFIWNVDAIVDGMGSAHGSHPPMRLTLLVMMAVPIYVVRRIQKLGELQRKAAPPAASVSAT